MKNESPEKQLLSKIKSVNNILITVSRNPNVDQLTAALGLSIALNKLGKRSVAVFSGKIPPAIRFLQPEKTFENNADSLRDFIISLDKDKADRLKVRPDGDFVKVYITPYRTKISKGDLKFEEGDFNIELIIAIGVGNRDELDSSIASHGKIFHNAVTATLNLEQTHDILGMISWQDNKYGCYAQMCYELIDELDNDGKLIDESIATALLTGVVSATDQFRNKVTSPAIMTLSANLMSRGADQQLVTSELESSDGLDDSQVNQVNESSDEGVAFSRNDVQSGGQTGGNNDVQSSTTVYKLGDSNVVSSDPIEARLAEDNSDVSRQRGEEALRATQAKLLETEGSIYGAPEAPRIESQPTEMNYEVENTGEQVMPPQPQLEQAVEMPAEQAATLSQPASPSGSAQVAPSAGGYLETPSVNNSLVPDDEQPTLPDQREESYLVDGDGQTIQPLVNDGDNLPFNPPNQVSPIQNNQPAPDLSQPLNTMGSLDQTSMSVANAMTTMDTMQTVATMNPAPDMNLPMPPPLPAMPTVQMAMPPDIQSVQQPDFTTPIAQPPEQLAGNQPVTTDPSAYQQPIVEPVQAPVDATPLQQQPAPVAQPVNDPSQFVIPS